MTLANSNTPRMRNATDVVNEVRDNTHRHATRRPVETQIADLLRNISDLHIDLVKAAKKDNYTKVIALTDLLGRQRLRLTELQAELASQAMDRAPVLIQSPKDMRELPVSQASGQLHRSKSNEKLLGGHKGAGPGKRVRLTKREIAKALASHAKAEHKGTVRGEQLSRTALRRMLKAKRS